MTLRLVQVGNSIPVSYPVDPNAEFQPGMIGQLKVMGNNIVVGVSDGSAPFGIIDDIKTRAFTSPSIDEVKIAANVPSVMSGGYLVSTIDAPVTLDNPNIIASSFITSPIDVELIPRNGVIIFPAGTRLNFDLDGDGIPDSIRTVVSYTYQVPNIPGDDSTLASQRVTIWIFRGIYNTDQYETNRRYPINANLFVSERGLLTTAQATADTPAVGFVTGSPSAIFGSLEFEFL